MTELEWLYTVEPERMLDFLKDKASGRKFRLFACACVRELGHLLKDERSRRAYFVAERMVEGTATNEERYAASLGAERAWQGLRVGATRYLASAVIANRMEAAANAARLLIGSVRCMRSGWEIAAAVAEAAQALGCYIPPASRTAVRAGQCDLAREVFGNPLRPSPFDPAWAQRNDGAVRKLATTIYEEKSFEGMPILADALIDAGCEDTAIIAHCQTGGDHGRGCWVIDGLLGRA
jgi:hypothetical protein